MSNWPLIVVIGVIVGLLLVVRWRPAFRVTVYDYQRAVLYNRGRFQKLLGPGAHWVIRPPYSVQVVDMRSRVVSVPGQEILSADNVSVKISLAIRFRVAVPEVAIASAQSFEQALYLEAQLILRDLVSALPIEELLQKRAALATQLRERLEPKAAALGLVLETAGVKDIMFPGGLKQIFAQVIEARKSAQAALEKARGEAATLRNLANAAKLLEGNPALLTLKTLQAASDGKHTLVLGLSQPIVPIGQGGRELPGPETASSSPGRPVADTPEPEDA
jgi:regulator of protease activity HflC (stomatin/prohibitin superfamily)